MGLSTIDAGMAKKAFLAGAKELEAKKEWINELNVFPVPDGDTGTNMTMTVMAAAREVAALEDPSMRDLARAISSGSLRGARGNSGVILSQLFRGFTKEIQDAEIIDADVLARAMARGTETAYKAVMKPKEGTILTVAKGMSDKAQELSLEGVDMEALVREVIEEGDRVLERTPEMLPVLKQAGVVDSGGQGLMQVVKGFLKGLTGQAGELTLDAESGSFLTDGMSTAVRGQKSAAAGAASQDIETADIRFGYCTEFIINLEREYKDKDEEELKSYLASIGDSLVVVSDDSLVKVHVHTNHPGLAFEKALTYGSLSRMKVDNMREEHQERVIMDAERMAKEQAGGMSSAAASSAEPPAVSAESGEEETKPFSFISVAPGDGLREVFEGIGADWVIEGGQTMNPSTEDMLTAIDHVKGDVVYILPNNKNIILAARQAAELTKDRRVLVVPSATIPQGVTALVNFMPDLSPEENLENMEREMAQVRTAQITYAVRSTMVDGIGINEGDIMAIGDKGILGLGHTPFEAGMEAMKAMLDDDMELITLYYGADVKEEEALRLKEAGEELFPDKEFELQYGGQPIYYYIISAE